MDMSGALDIGLASQAYAFEGDCALDLSEPCSGPSGSRGSRSTGTVVVGQIVRSSDVSHLSNLDSTICSVRSGSRRGTSFLGAGGRLSRYPSSCGTRIPKILEVG